MAESAPHQTPLTLESLARFVEDSSQSTENRLASVDASLAEIRELLATLTAAAPPYAYQTPPHLAGRSTASPVPPATPQTFSRVKPADPRPFNGSREHGRSFLNSCTIYFALAGDQFADENARVLWALSFMNGGRAALFAKRAMTPGFAEFSLHSWTDFEDAFTRDFCEQHEEEHAQLALEGTAYHQARQSAEDYVDAFRDLVLKSRYQDERALIMKFCHGLLPSLEQQVANLPAKSRPTSLAAWYHRTVKAERNRQTNQLFRLAHRKSTGPLHHTPPA